MPYLLSELALSEYGLDFCSRSFTLTATARAGTVTLSSCPEVRTTLLRETEAIFGNEMRMARCMLEGAVYSMTVSGDDSEGMLLIDGSPARLEAVTVAPALREVAAYGSQNIERLGIRLHGIETGFTETVRAASVTSLNEIVCHGRFELLRVGARSVKVACPHCGLDYETKRLGLEHVPFVSPENCGFPFFPLLSRIVSRAGNDLLATLEIPQLRRVRLQLAEAVPDIPCILPVVDPGEPAAGPVLSESTLRRSIRLAQVYDLVYEAFSQEGDDQLFDLRSPTAAAVLGPRKKPDYGPH